MYSRGHARAYLLKIFMLIIYSVEIFHAFNFRGARVHLTLNISRFMVIMCESTFLQGLHNMCDSHMCQFHVCV